MNQAIVHLKFTLTESERSRLCRDVFSVITSDVQDVSSGCFTRWQRDFLHAQRPATLSLTSVHVCLTEEQKKGMNSDVFKGMNSDVFKRMNSDVFQEMNADVFKGFTSESSLVSLVSGVFGHEN